MLKQTRLWLLASVAITGIMTGCTPEAKQDYDQAGSAVTSAAKSTGKALSEDTKSAGNSMSKMAGNTKAALTNDQTSASVQEALVAAKDLKIDSLRVDTDDKKVTVQGYVHSAADKSRASTIAKGVLGPGYTLQDKIAVAKP